jgi:NADPH:quinone reductase-like Zn-dependent oxidoreductase
MALIESPAHSNPLAGRKNRSRSTQLSPRPEGALLAVLTTGELADLDETERPTLCFDTAGGPVLPEVVEAMARGGRIVNLSATGDGQVTFDLRQFYRSRLSLHDFGTGAYDVVQNARVLALLRPGFDNGQLRRPQIAATFPLPKAADAYALMEQHPQGKVVLTMSVPT